MREPLPTFRFHPDPVQSGAVEPSPEPCGCCGKARGHVYTGPCYVEDDFDAVLCPWCIADGSAFRRFGVTFADIEPQPDFDPRIAAELEERTPGITTWNPIDWPACCKTPMAYLEPAGHAELTARHAELTAALPAWGATELDMTPDEATQLCQRLQRDHAPTAHVFRCLVCRRPRAVFDFD
ncbi:MAG: CbrC family protein [Planctomycetes bacterium]|nr:CbrC family protein [Planctomycetota bacterium]